MAIRTIIAISTILYRLGCGQDNQKGVVQIDCEDKDEIFFVDSDGTDPSYTLSPDKAWAIKIENDEVCVYRIYSGRTINDLTVLPLDRVRDDCISDYEAGYLNSYFYQMYNSGEIN